MIGTVREGQKDWEHRGTPSLILEVGEAFPEGGRIKRSPKGRRYGEGRVLSARQTVVQRLKCENVEIWDSKKSSFLGVKHGNATDGIYLKEVF